MLKKCTNLSNILVLQKRAIYIMLDLDHNEAVKENVYKLKTHTVLHKGLYIFQTIIIARLSENIPKLGDNHK